MSLARAPKTPLLSQMPAVGKRKLVQLEPDLELQLDAQGLVDTELVPSAAASGASGLAFFRDLGLHSPSNTTLFACMCEQFVDGTLEKVFGHFGDYRAARVNPKHKCYEEAKTDTQPDTRGSGEGATCTRLQVGAIMTNGWCAA